jgi:hypothetical protein
MKNQITALRRNGEKKAVAKGSLQIGWGIAASENELDQLGGKSEKHLITD